MKLLPLLFALLAVPAQARVGDEALPPWAQPEGGEPVRVGEVVFEGTELKGLRALVALEDGAPLDPRDVRDAVRAIRPASVLIDAPHGEVPAALLFPADADRVPAPREPGPRRPATDRFETMSWTSERPVSLPRLQQAIGRLAPKLARAKGLFETVEQPGRLTVFQLAGGRATLAPGGTRASGVPRARIVFIAEIGGLSIAEIDAIMETCIEGPAVA